MQVERRKCMASNCNAIALVKEPCSDIRLARVSKTLVSPTVAPAVSNNKALVLRIAHNARRMSTAGGFRLECIEVAVRRRCVIPRGIDVDPDQDRTVGGEPYSPPIQIL